MNDEQTIFTEALAKPSQPERSVFLDEACGDRVELRARVEELLAAHDRAGAFLESPPPGVTLAIEAGGEARVALAEGPGTTVGRYKLLEQIGEGGMGVVFMAEQTHPVRRRVALKIVKPGLDTREVIARFEAERQALALMDHPNIAKVFDAGATDAGRPYFAMELVRGLPITDYCDQQQLPPRQRLELFVEVCRAVQHAHQKGIIHRDLKPNNVLITVADDGRAVPKVIDFGIAKATTAGQRLTEQTLFTQFQQMIGTPLYMSPEQAEMSAVTDVDTRSDVYSLGVLLYELLTGTTPFNKQRLAEAAYDEVRRILRDEEPPRPSTRISTLGETLTSISIHRGTDPKRLGQLVRGELDWIVMRALEKDRARRYDTANGLARDVERYLEDQPVEACPPSRTYRMRKFIRRNKAAVMTTALVAAILVLATTVSAWQAVRATRAKAAAVAAETRAERQRDRALTAEQQAARERDEAERQRGEAESANASMTAVNSFLTEDLLTAATPEVARGREVTVKEALDKAAASVGNKFSGQPLTEAAVRHALAETYLAIGRADLALPHAQLALEQRRQKLGDDHPATIDSIRQAGILLRDQRKPGAESHLRESLERSRRVLGPEHPATIRAVSDEAGLLWSKGEWGEAEQLYLQLLDVHRRLYGNDDRRTLGAQYDVAWVKDRREEHGKGRSDQSHAMLEQTRRKLGVDHPQTLRALLNFCDDLIVGWKHVEAEPYIREAVKETERVCGEHHPYTLDAIENLARMHSHRFQHAEAAEVLVDLLERTRRLRGRDSPAALWVLQNLATERRNQGMLQEAEAMFREVLSREQNIGALCGLAAVLAARGEAEEADLLRREALKQCERRLSGDDPDAIAWMVGTVNGVQYYDNNHAEAEPLRRAIVAASRRVNGDDHTTTLYQLRALEVIHERAQQFDRAEPLARELLQHGHEAIVTLHRLKGYLEKQGRHEEAKQLLSEAEPLLREVLERRRRKYGETHVNVGYTLAALGRLLVQQGRHAEAEPLLADVYRRAVARNFEDSQERARAASTYGPCLVRLGKFAQAEEPLRFAYEQLEAAGMGRDGSMTAVVQALATVYDETARPEEAARWRARLTPQMPEVKVVELAGGVRVLDGFEAGPGHFSTAVWSGGANAPSCGTTVGVTGRSIAELVATGGHTGNGMQRIALYSVASTSRPGFTFRHLSGGGTPTRNFRMGTSGSVGFFLRTTTPGLQVLILIDENLAVTPPNMEQGRPIDVIADGQWHLCQWDLRDPDQWIQWGDVPGDGKVDGPVVTVDAVLLTSATNQDAEVYLDTVAYNPNGPLDARLLLAPEPAAAEEVAPTTRAAPDAAQSRPDAPDGPGSTEGSGLRKVTGR